MNGIVTFGGITDYEATETVLDVNTWHLLTILVSYDNRDDSIEIQVRKNNDALSSEYTATTYKWY